MHRCLTLIFLFALTESSRRIRVRSHGEAPTGDQEDQRSFEAVLGLNLAPRNVLRVRSRGSKDAQTLAAAEAASNKAKELLEQGRVPAKDIRDLQPIESSLIPVSQPNLQLSFLC